MTDSTRRAIRRSDDLTDQGVISLAEEVETVSNVLGIVLASSFALAAFSWGTRAVGAALHEHQVLVAILLPLLGATIAAGDIVRWLGIRKRNLWLRRAARSRHLTQLNKKGL